VRFGVHLPQWGPIATRDGVLACARTIEECGFDSAWVADHVVFPLQGAERYPYSDSGTPFGPEDGFLEAFTTLALAAGVTRRIALGTSALVLAMREPLLVAKTVATLDVLSGGRTILAVGAGWCAEEFRALGVPFEGRGRRLEEAIRVLRALWSEGALEHRGECFRFAELACEPRPVQPGGPPIWIAGNGPAAWRRVARLGDGWHPIRVRPEELAAGRAQIDRLAREEGRDPSAIGTSTAVGMTSDPARAVERMLELARGGVTHVVLAAPGAGVRERCGAIERFASEVLPAVRKELAPAGR
jgi:probable F420-dependent oxidoreductase